MNWAENMWDNAVNQATQYHKHLSSIGRAFYNAQGTLTEKRMALEIIISRTFNTEDPERIQALSILALDSALPETQMTSEDRQVALHVAFGI